MLAGHRSGVAAPSLSAVSPPPSALSACPSRRPQQHHHQQQQLQHQHQQHQQFQQQQHQRAAGVSQHLHRQRGACRIGCTGAAGAESSGCDTLHHHHHSHHLHHHQQQQQPQQQPHIVACPTVGGRHGPAHAYALRALDTLSSFEDGEELPDAHQQQQQQQPWGSEGNGEEEEDLLYPPRSGVCGWSHTDQPGVDLLLHGPAALEHLQVHVILFGVGERDTEGIYSLRAFGDDGLPQETIIVFEGEEDAQRYAGLLEATMDHIPNVCSIPPRELLDFCVDQGYNCRMEPCGSLLIPPDFNVGVTDWERSMRLRDGRWAVLDAEPEHTPSHDGDDAGLAPGAAPFAAPAAATAADDDDAAAAAAAAKAGGTLFGHMEGHALSAAHLPAHLRPSPTASPHPLSGGGGGGGGSSSSSAHGSPVQGAGGSAAAPVANATSLARYHPSFSSQQLQHIREQLEGLLPGSGGGGGGVGRGQGQGEQ